jgi:ABC-type transport system involved in cytochrome c biogenesis permease subunit
MAETQDHDERKEERLQMGFGFAILLASLLSLPLWAGIIWLAQWFW